MDTEKQTTATEEEAAPAAVEIAPSVTDGIVEVWFADTFHGLVGLDTATYNRFRRAADELKQHLNAALAKE